MSGLSGATRPIGDLVSITRGKTYKSRLLGEPGPVLLGLSTIARNGGFRSDSLRTYGGDSPENLIVKPGELFASLKDVTQSADLLGSVARLPEGHGVGRLTQDTVRLDLKANDASIEYLYYALLTPAYRAFCRSHATGTTNLGLPREDFLGYEIPFPPLEEQERIAGVLGAFDDLIETNRRLATYLETLAKAVSSRPQGRVPLAQVADVPRLVQRRPEGLVDHYSIPAYDSGYLASRESGEAILSGKQMLVTDSVLISRLNPTTERTWMVYPDELVSAVCSPEFAVVRGTEALPSEVLWALASRPDFWDQMRGSVGGTTNSRQRVDKAAIPAFEVPDPNELSEPEVATIEMCVRSAVQLRREAAAVSSQRDELLPLLMSGRVRVRDVEAAVS